MKPQSKINLDSEDDINSHDAQAVSHIEDGVVWKGLRNGNKSSLTYIYRNYVHSLYSYGCQISPDKELVRDAIQDLFMDLIKHSKSLKEVSSIKFYLFKSLRNRIVKMLKRRMKEIAERQTEIQESFLVTTSHELNLIGQQITEEKGKLIASSLNQLPVLQREALLLYFYEGMKYDQIASILGMKVKSARALVYRAIHSMGTLLGPSIKKGF